MVCFSNLSDALWVYFEEGFSFGHYTAGFVLDCNVLHQQNLDFTIAAYSNSIQFIATHIQFIAAHIQFIAMLFSLQAPTVLKRGGPCYNYYNCYNWAQECLIAHPAFADAGRLDAARHKTNVSYMCCDSFASLGSILAFMADMGKHP